MSEYVFFEDEVVECTKTTDLYQFFGLKRPNNILLSDEKTKNKLKNYILREDESIDELRRKSIVMYLYISPKVQKNETIAQALYRAALEVTAEETTGTWDENLKTITPEMIDSDSQKNLEILQGKVIGLNVKNGMVACALPQEGFERGSLSQLFSVIVGNYTGMTSQVHAVRLEDCEIPDDFVNSFLGPCFGPFGIWRKIETEEHTPLIGTIIKPKTGLSPRDWAKFADMAFRGGLDVVKDDENLTDQEYCTFYERAKIVLDALSKIKKDTGRTCVYVANITAATTDEMIKRAQFVKDNGGNCIMIDIFAAGWTALQTIRSRFQDLIIHGHRAGHGAQTVVPEVTIDGKIKTIRHGIAMKIYCMFARLGGVDQLHIGAPLGKMEAHDQTIHANLEMIRRPMGKINCCLAINSGGISPDKFSEVLKAMDPTKAGVYTDIIFQAGGGTHAHPLGTFGGAKTMMQARKKFKENISLFDALNRFYELRLAYRRWSKDTYDRWIKSLTSTSEVVIDPDTRDVTNKGKDEPEPKKVVLKDAIERDPTLKEDIAKNNPSILN